MKARTNVVCWKCRKMEDIDHAREDGWLIAPRKNSEYLVIRCPEHITKYALSLVRKGEAK